MSTNNFVVVFIAGNARIIHNPEDMAHWENCPDALVNPDLTSVRGIPPHFWKRVGKEVCPMTPEEQSERESHHDKHGVDNSILLPPLPAPSGNPDVLDDESLAEHWGIMIYVLILVLGAILVGMGLGWVIFHH